MTVDGTEYTVMSCTYGCTQQKGPAGMPSGPVTSHEIHIVVQSDDSTKLFDWAADPNGKKDGEIAFPKLTEEGTMKKLEFKQGAIIGYTESFGGGSFMTSIAITARVIKLGGIPVDSLWEGKKHQ